jgi:hypothetical protein
MCYGMQVLLFYISETNLVLSTKFYLFNLAILVVESSFVFDICYYIIFIYGFKYLSLALIKDVWKKEEYVFIFVMPVTCTENRNK